MPALKNWIIRVYFINTADDRYIRTCHIGGFCRQRTESDRGAGNNPYILDNCMLSWIVCLYSGCLRGCQNNEEHVCVGSYEKWISFFTISLNITVCYISHILWNPTINRIARTTSGGNRSIISSRRIEPAILRRRQLIQTYRRSAKTKSEFQCLLHVHGMQMTFALCRQSSNRDYFFCEQRISLNGMSRYICTRNDTTTDKQWINQPCSWLNNSCRIVQR